MLLALHQSPVPQIDISRDAGGRAQAKIAHFRSSASAGSLRILRMTEAELNGWLASSAALESDPGGREKGDGDPDRPSNIRDLRVKLLDNRIRTYVGFDFHGKEMSLELEGMLAVQDGYLRLKPIAGKLGSLPLPPPALDHMVNRMFYSRENRERFRLSEDIRELRVEGRELVIEAR
jgi:hypothetical protein